MSCLFSCYIYEANQQNKRAELIPNIRFNNQQQDMPQYCTCQMKDQQLEH